MLLPAEWMMPPGGEADGVAAAVADLPDASQRAADQDHLAFGGGVFELLRVEDLQARFGEQVETALSARRR
jgi:hypothetical protein